MTKFVSGLALVIAICALAFSIASFVAIQKLPNSTNNQATETNTNQLNPPRVNTNSKINSTGTTVGENTSTAPGAISGPYLHQVYTAVSDDGVSWTKLAQVIEHASVPQAIVLDDGTVRIFYVDANQQPENVNCADLSSNFSSATVQDCEVVGLPDGYKMVDPTIVRLDDGRYRLYFYEALTTGQINSEDDHAIASAISIDAQHFTYEGKVFIYPGLVDPDVFWDGEQWRMYVFASTDRDTIVATSKNGTDFEYVGPLGIGKYGTTSPVSVGNGIYRMYAFSQEKDKLIVSFTATAFDDWKLESGERLNIESGREITDPQVVKLQDGRWLMVYKESDTPSQDQQPLNVQPL